MQVGGQYRQCNGVCKPIGAVGANPIETAMLEVVDCRLDRRVLAPCLGECFRLLAFAVSGHYEPWLRDRTQCGGGSWLYGPRSDRRGSSANSDFHIRGVSSIARLAGCMLIRWSTSTR